VFFPDSPGAAVDEELSDSADDHRNENHKQHEQESPYLVSFDDFVIDRLREPITFRQQLCREDHIESPVQTSSFLSAG